MTISEDMIAYGEAITEGERGMNTIAMLMMLLIEMWW